MLKTAAWCLVTLLGVSAGGQSVRAADGAASQNVPAETSRDAAARRADDPAEDAKLNPPFLLGPPTTADETDWAVYLFKAFDRVDPDCAESAPSVIVLRAPDAGDYANSEGWVGDALTGKLPSDIIMLASPASPENLIKVLTAAVREMAPNALKRSRVYVAVPAVYSERAVAALAPTGATVIYLDPARPITLPKDRLECRVTSAPLD